MYFVGGIVAVVVVAGILLAYSGNIFGYGKPQQTVQTAREPSLSVSPQALSGGDVVVDSLYLDKPGFVVIHKNDNGAPGAVIGHSDLISGEKSRFKVAVDSSQVGSKVFAMLHYDDNGNGIYEFPQEDKPVKLADKVVVKPIAITSASGSQVPDQNQITTTVTVETPKTFTVEMSGSGFSPSALTISSGDTVTFLSKSGTHQPASNIHPSHKLYPESGGACGTSAFDACRGLNAGESWSLKFDKKGTWGYHDHLNPGVTGQITVQ